MIFIDNTTSAPCHAIYTRCWYDQTVHQLQKITRNLEFQLDSTLHCHDMFQTINKYRSWYLKEYSRTG